MRVNNSYLSHHLEHLMDVKKYQRDLSIDRFEQLSHQSPTPPMFVEYTDHEERLKN